MKRKKSEGFSNWEALKHKPNGNQGRICSLKLVIYRDWKTKTSAETEREKAEKTRPLCFPGSNYGTTVSRKCRQLKRRILRLPCHIDGIAEAANIFPVPDNEYTFYQSIF